MPSTTPFRHRMNMLLAGLGLLIGLLLMLGNLTIAWTVPVIGVLLLVYGILMALDLTGRNPILGALLALSGALVVMAGWSLPYWVTRTMDVGIGLLLALVSISRLAADNVTSEETLDDEVPTRPPVRYGTIHGRP